MDKSATSSSRPRVADILTTIDFGSEGERMHALIAELYPICRSITGDGVRETLDRIAQEIPLAVREVPSGTEVFDWTVPREWNVRDAYIKNASGERVVDFRRSNLHLMSYSTPIHTRVGAEELQRHLYSLPEHPEWIPYRTSYYVENWAFCVTEEQRSQLTDGEFEVCVDSTLDDGVLSYGECVLDGDEADEVLISCHVCHPSLCNDNLSGISVALALARALVDSSHRYTYRFLFIPGTIGSITWLAQNEVRAESIKHGLVLTCVGDPGPSTYKRSRRGDAEVDRAMVHVLASSGVEHSIEDFIPWGYDERQYCSPGFDLPVGCLMRTPHGCFPEYHTSADDLELVRPAALADTFEKCLRLFRVLEGNRNYRNTNPKCEPQLGKRGLYGAIGGQADREASQMALLWVLNLSDGSNSLLDVAERSGLPFATIEWAATALAEQALLVRAEAA